MKTAFYVRTKQNVDEEGLDEQKETLRTYCEKQGIPAATVQDGMSVLDRLKKDMKAGKVETVITTKENRKYVEER